MTRWPPIYGQSVTVDHIKRLALVTYLLAGCESPQMDRQLDDTHPKAELEIVYARPFFVREPLPKRFSLPLPSSIGQLKAGEYPPSSFVRSALGRGDAAMRAKLIASMRRAAGRGGLTPALRWWYTSVFGPEPDLSCSWLGDMIRKESHQAVRDVLWSVFVRCHAPKYAPMFDRADVPDWAIVDWSSRQDGAPSALTPRLLRAAKSVVRRGEVNELRAVGIALANTKGGRGVVAIRELQRGLSPERRAWLAAGLSTRTEPAAQALALGACQHPEVANDWLCHWLWDSDASLTDRVKQQHQSLAGLLRRHERTDVIKALSDCVEGAQHAEERAICLRRLAVANRPAAVSTAKSLGVGDLQTPLAEVARAITDYEEDGLVAELERLQLINPLRGDRGDAVTAADFLGAHGKSRWLDTRTGQFSNQHDELLVDLALLVRPALDGVVFEEVVPIDAPGPCRLRAYMGNKMYELEATNWGDWFDVQSVIGLLNTLLRIVKSEQRFVTLSTGDQAYLVVAGREEALRHLVASGLVHIANPAVENVAEVEHPTVEADGDVELDLGGGKLEAGD
ncbi:MAG: hypothetical protein A2289_21355 [Deltaproteobacteria bacterium RIFOXYA12_FULL_58_15]|nr:MAG: hypothetical protein A2289_21355 [Deltaproteobacteria bacterium RIFOXYA12_FULL_58_15]